MLFLKRIFTVALLPLGVAMIVASSAQAVPFWSEPFNYSDGGLPAVSGGNWAFYSGTGTQIQVVGGEAVVNNANGLVFDTRPFPLQGPTAKTYACLRVKISAPAGGAAPVSSYFACFQDASPWYTARVFVRPVVGDPTKFVFGLGAIGSITIVEWATPLDFGIYYTIATMYDTATGNATMWVDPSGEGSTNVTAIVNISTLPYRMSAFALRQSGPVGPNWQATVDDIQVGNSFGDICGTVVPTSNATWGELKSLYR